jgi:hypothetical protein
LDTAGFLMSFPQEFSPHVLARGMKFADGPLPEGGAVVANAGKMSIDCSEYLSLL